MKRWDWTLVLIAGLGGLTEAVVVALALGSRRAADDLAWGFAVAASVVLLVLIVGSWRR